MINRGVILITKNMLNLHFPKLQIRMLNFAPQEHNNVENQPIEKKGICIYL